MIGRRLNEIKQKGVRGLLASIKDVFTPINYGRKKKET